MSFLSTNARVKKKTALKLLNKYADSYHAIIQENNFLKTEILDLKANIKINKEIIQGFFSEKKFKEKIDLYNFQYKKENENLYNQNDKLLKKIEELTSKFTYNEQIFNETLNQARDENEKLKTKLFTIEQNNTKKDNIILVQKKKIEQLKDDFSLVDREIYISDPYKAIIQINDELLIYKEIYDNFSNIIKGAKSSIARYESLIQHLQIENQNLRNQYKNHVFTSNKEKDNLIFSIQKKKNVFINRVNTDNGNISKNQSNNLIKYERSKTLENINHLVDDRKFENDEFLEFIKMVELNQREYELISRDKKYYKIFDLIDVLYTNFIEKNVIISLLEKENDNINQKNFQLNKDNMNLFQENLQLKEEINILKNKNLINKNTKTDKTNESYINNTSKIIANPKIQNTLINYQNFLLNQQLENKANLNNQVKLDKESGIYGGDEDSKHDSIIYIKNKKDNDYIIKLNESNGNTPEYKLVKPIKLEDKNNEENDSILSNKKENEKTKDDKFALTLASITSSEFRDGCKGIESFLYTIKKNSIQNNNNENGNTTNENDFDFWNNQLNIKEV